MYELLEKLEALIEKWESKPYIGSFSQPAICAKELREVIGKSKPRRRWIQDTSSNDVALQKGYFEDV